ncbi:hypothetical protein [Aeromonas hydrophila]|uniref:hypothetical protein n=1 Tax=Aeromonas hydrophila TaxID=644 RepID=UPI001A93981C|nr:hypothetical protein [Aeromonas hydrophila]MBO0407438.1 hypothetical protein [Aeromonas hydrophila]
MRDIDEQAGLSISARKRKSDEKGEKGKVEKQKAIIADGLLSWNFMVPGVGLEPTRLFTGGF